MSNASTYDPSQSQPLFNSPPPRNPGGQSFSSLSPGTRQGLADMRRESQQERTAIIQELRAWVIAGTEQRQSIFSRLERDAAHATNERLSMYEKMRESEARADLQRKSLYEKLEEGEAQRKVLSDQIQNLNGKFDQLMDTLSGMRPSNPHFVNSQSPAPQQAPQQAQSSAPPWQSPALFSGGTGDNTKNNFCCYVSQHFPNRE